MKIPITDQFLWMIYKFFETTNDVLETPEIFKLKTWRNIAPLGTSFWRTLERRRNRKQFFQFINYLKRKGYIEIANLKEKQCILLTPRGENKVLKLRFKLTNKKKRKDKKWIMIMYDIPEKKRRNRGLLREVLQSLEYQRLQKSIWVSPYDVLKETKKAIVEYSLDSYVNIFLIEKIGL